MDSTTTSNQSSLPLTLWLSSQGYNLTISLTVGSTSERVYVPGHAGVYVPGHAGVTCNEAADQLAASCHTRTPLELFSSDVKLLGMERWKRHLCSSIEINEELCHLKCLIIPLGALSSSTLNGPTISSSQGTSVPPL